MNKLGVIGGLIADIEGNPYGQIKNGDDNPATIYMSYTGTGRNIVENLARIGEEVLFVSATGDDFTGQGAVRQLQDLGVDVNFVKLFKDENTAVNMSILNIVGILEMAFSNGDVHKQINADIVEEALTSLKECTMVAVDGYLTTEALESVIKKLAGIPLFYDPVSVQDAEKAKELIGKFHTIKPNRTEAEILSGMKILSEEELIKAGQWFIDQGVKNVFITLSGGGVYYTDGEHNGFIRPEATKIISEEGAGDAFSAAILSAFLKGLDIKTTAEYAMAMASLTLEAKKAVNEGINAELLEERFKELFSPKQM